jgi:hypothetical protein
VRVSQAPTPQATAAAAAERPETRTASCATARRLVVVRGWRGQARATGLALARVRAAGSVRIGNAARPPCFDRGAAQAPRVRQASRRSRLVHPPLRAPHSSPGSAASPIGHTPRRQQEGKSPGRRGLAEAARRDQVEHRLPTFSSPQQFPARRARVSSVSGSARSLQQPSGSVSRVGGRAPLPVPRATRPPADHGRITHGESHRTRVGGVKNLPGPTCRRAKRATCLAADVRRRKLTTSMKSRSAAPATANAPSPAIQSGDDLCVVTGARRASTPLSLTARRYFLPTATHDGEPEASEGRSRAAPCEFSTCIKTAPPAATRDTAYHVTFPSAPVAPHDFCVSSTLSRLR